MKKRTTGYHIIIIFLLVGISLWIIDGVIDYLILGDQTLSQAIITQVPLNSVLMRSFALIGLLLCGIIMMSATRTRLETSIRLKRSHNQLQLLLESSTDIIVTIDYDGVVLTINHLGARVAKRTPEQCVGRPLIELLDRDFAQTLLTGVRRIVETGESKANDLKIVVDGTTRWYRHHLHPVAGIASESPRAVLCMARDITKQKLAEEAQHTSEKQYRSVIETATDAIISVNARGKIVSWNRAAQEMFGYAQDEIIGESIGMLLPDDSRRRIEAAFSFSAGHTKTKRIGKTTRGVAVRSDGTSFPIEMSLQNWALNGEEFFTSIVRDVTEQVESNRELQELQAELESRITNSTSYLATLNEIANVVSHTLDPDMMLQETLETVLHSLDLKAGMVYHRDPSTGDLELVAHTGLEEKYMSTMIRGKIARRALMNGKPVIVDDLARDADMPAGLVEEGRHSIACIPLIAKAKTNGVMTIVRSNSTQFVKEDIEFLASIGYQIGVAAESAQLYEQAQQLAIVKERQRLARELHDSVTQTLYGAMLYARAAAGQLSAGQIDAVQEYLEEVKETTREALAEMRLLIYELRPSAVEAEGMITALQARLHAVEERAGVKTEFAIEGVNQLPPEIEDGLYRIAQESLNNSLKHAHARSVCLDLRQDRSAVTLEIRDDGVGFDTAVAATQGGMGLVTMNERATGLGGKLCIDSMPGNGTRVLAEVRV